MDLSFCRDRGGGYQVTTVTAKNICIYKIKKLRAQYFKNYEIHKKW